MAVDDTYNGFANGRNKAMRESEEGGFAFERLDVYPRAVEFLVVVTRMISELPSGNASWTDPLRRAALSGLHPNVIEIAYVYGHADGKTAPWRIVTAPSSGI